MFALRTQAVALARQWGVAATRSSSTHVLASSSTMLPLSRLQAFIGQHFEHQDAEVMKQPSFQTNDSFDSAVELDHMGLNLQWAYDADTILKDMEVRSVPAATTMVAAEPAVMVEISRPIVAEPPTLDSTGFQLSSVLKKRHRKMKRHKYKKWRKKMRSTLQKK
eukprot:m.88306 g.88306  ORF g.88306 m.88306 type:complete len:164 (-) comp14823_c0_seq1:2984-3475(-)